MAREELLSRTFVELADNLVADFDVVDFLTFLATRCVELLEVTSAGILLADAQGNLRYAASSNEDAEMLELLGLQLDEGPCLDSFRGRETVVNHDLSGVTPWPRFSPTAVEAGILSVHAVPMRLRDTAIGSLNLFGAEARSLAPADILVAQAIADVATISIVQNRAARDSQVVTDQLELALNSRVLIEQAKGVLAERLQVDVNEAFTRLRSYSRSHSRRLSDVAGAVIDGSLAAKDLLATPEGV